MEACTLRALNVTAMPFHRAGLAERSLLYGQALRLPNARKYSFGKRVKFLEFRAPSSAKLRVNTIEAASKGITPKEDDLAFVAGATGRVGSRAVRELLKIGFRVRACVRNAKKAEGLVQSVKQMKLDGDKDVQPVEKLELVECDLEKPNEILPALGNASVVLCCIGASEKEVFDITGPYRIDYQAATNLINAATSAKVNHFIMVSSLGTNKIGFPAAILNLFWGVLIWKRRAEEALIASGIPYTIVRPGGMERPTDAYKLTHNITLSEEDTLFGGQVSTLQVAELMAVMAKNRSLSYCKVVEVIAETTAPLTPMEQLLAKIHSERAEPPKLEVPDAVVNPAVTQPPSNPIDKGTITTELTATTAAVSPEPPSTQIDKEDTIPEPPATRPLSPYAAYEDLKPPTSPSPLPPITQKQSEEVSVPVPDVLLSEVNVSSVSDTETAEEITPSIELIEAKSVEVTKPQPLSPYTVYDDLKPPTSPIPVPSGQKEVTSGSPLTEQPVEEPVEVNAVAVLDDGDVKEDPPKDSSIYRSPYFVYDDFKPPTSPSPSSPPSSASSVNPPSDNNGAANPSEAVALPTDEHNIIAEPKKPTPLSPYAMYEDLKPPTSPTPFPSSS